MRDKIIVDKTKIPYRFAIDLGNQQFILDFKYNEILDVFTVSLFCDDILLAADEPIMYNFPLFKDIYQAKKFPIITIVPLDESNQTDLITWENFGKTIFLTLENGK